MASSVQRSVNGCEIQALFCNLNVSAAVHVIVAAVALHGLRFRQVFAELEFPDVVVDFCFSRSGKLYHTGGGGAGELYLEKEKFVFSLLLRGKFETLGTTTTESSRV